MNMNVRSVITLIAVFALVPLFAAPAAHAEAPAPLRLTVTVNWDVGLRVGVEYTPWERVGFAADIGSSLLSLEGAFILTYDAFVVFDVLPPQGRFLLQACIGIPDGRVVFVDPPAAEIAFGASAGVGYRFADRFDLFLRAGGGVPLFRESGDFRVGNTSFPLGLWPDLSLGAHFLLR